MATYLIDYENVNHGGLSGIESLKEQDRVILFLGKNTRDLPKETIHLLITSKPEIVFKKMRKIGKNYLDFQLAATLGLLIGNSAESDYFIISGDKDFEKVKDFVEPSRGGVTIKRQATIVIGKKSAASKVKPKVTQNFPPLPESYRKQIRAVIKQEKLSGGSYKTVYGIFAASPSQPKLQSGLAKHFQSAQGNRLYNLIRRVHEDYTNEPEQSSENS